eukprot:Awhi_evm1s9087
MTISNLDKKIATFRSDCLEHLSKYKNSSGVCLITAWLVTDNVIVDLFHRQFPELTPNVLSVDTLHLFDSTHELIERMKTKYEKFQPQIYKPLGLSTKEQFAEKYPGAYDQGNHAEFDEHSKIEPLRRAFKDCNKEVSITGRRQDQGNARTSLAVWEEENKTFNPLAEWTWSDIIEYVLTYDVPYNNLHKQLNISQEFVNDVDRYTFDFTRVTLEKPYFAYSKEEINSHGPNVYIWKSFGDTLSTVPVQFDESERSGRFVGRHQTECGIHTRMAGLGAPHGGSLKDRTVLDVNDSHLKDCTHKHYLTERQACDFELIANGGFSPLVGFMTEESYNEVVTTMRLPEGQLFGLPVTLDSNDESIKVGDYVELIDDLFKGHGVMLVESKWVPDRTVEAKHVYGTENTEHPAVFHLYEEKKKYNLGGKIWAIQLPERGWVKCKTPKQIRQEMKGFKRLVAFQSRNPLHRAHVSMFENLTERLEDCQVLVHPVVGPTKGDDIPADVRKDTYDQVAKIVSNVHFEYLPYNMMVGGPREALQHALIRKNYGCTHIIIGRDHAGCKDKSGNDFYGAMDAQELLKPLQEELGIEMVPFKAMVYAAEESKYIPFDEASQKGYKPMSISGTKFRKMLVEGEPIPQWFAYPEVVDILRVHASKKISVQA